MFRAVSIHKKMSLIVSSTIIASLAIGGCSATDNGSGTTSASYSSERPSGVISAVANGIEAVGGGMNGSSLISSRSGTVRAAISASNCSTHGEPQETNGSSISSSDARYPGYLTYCKMTIDDGSPDTVQGTFALVKAISCALESQGLTFDGTSRSITFTPSATCFSAGQLNDMGTDPITVSVTASKPAAFNSYFDSGIRIVQAAMDVDFSLAVKVTSSAVEFATYETNIAGDKLGATFGSLNLSTGEIRAEARMQRLDCGTSGSCGWNRHWRIYADTTLVNGSPDGLETLSFAYTDISSPPGQAGYQGVLVTASGTSATGFKARAWQATNGMSGVPTAKSHYYTAGNWEEVVNNKCYLGGSESATSCGSGVDKFSTNANFVLNSSAGSGGTTQSAWFTSFAGKSYTSVDPDQEAQ